MLAFLGGQCWVCGEVEGLQLHHEHYDPVESDYPRHARTFAIRVKRVDEAEKNPGRFRALCPTCHGWVHALAEGTVSEEEAVAAVSTRMRGRQA